MLTKISILFFIELYYKMDIEEFSGDISTWDIYTIINYIKVHIVQFILLILVFIIIYVVDSITNMNASVFSLPSAIPGISTTTNAILTPIKNKIKKLKKQSKKTK